MTADLFHIGHLRVIRQCRKQGVVVIGLLSDKAIKNYRGQYPIIPYWQRKEILEALPEVSMVVKQNSLAFPFKKGLIDYVASGDGFEPEELKSIKELGCRKLDIKLKGERRKRFSSTAIKNKICLLCKKSS